MIIEIIFLKIIWNLKITTSANKLIKNKNKKIISQFLFKLEKLKKKKNFFHFKDLEKKLITILSIFLKLS